MSRLAKLDKFADKVTPARTYYIFALIYIPVAVLFLNRGLLAEGILSIYTLIMMVATLLMVLRFCMVLARHADDNSGKYGTLFLAFIVYKFMPLLFSKVLIYTFWRLLPACACRKSFLGDVFVYFSDLFRIFNPQYLVNLALVGGIVLMTLLAVWAVGRKK